MIQDDATYLATIVSAVRTCGAYKPKFGQGKSGGFSLSQFQEHYQADPFYSWFGLDNPLMYAAHKAAGGMTSVYRQIGIGCEKVFREVLRDALDLADEDVIWSYETTTPAGKTRKLTLDGRVPYKNVPSEVARTRFHNWMFDAAKDLGVDAGVFSSLTGAVFEVRQGYKSKDSKRQNADIANASTAYIKSYLPAVAVLSNQIDESIKIRYRAEKWVIMTGTIGLNDPLHSTYDFMKEVVGYDLAGFFERNKDHLRSEVNIILKSLLTPDAK